MSELSSLLVRALLLLVWLPAPRSRYNLLPLLLPDPCFCTRVHKGLLIDILDMSDLNAKEAQWRMKSPQLVWLVLVPMSWVHIGLGALVVSMCLCPAMYRITVWSSLGFVIVAAPLHTSLWTLAVASTSDNSAHDAKGPKTLPREKNAEKGKRKGWRRANPLGWAQEQETFRKNLIIKKPHHKFAERTLDFSKNASFVYFSVIRKSSETACSLHFLQEIALRGIRHPQWKTLV